MTANYLHSGNSQLTAHIWVNDLLTEGSRAVSKENPNPKCYILTKNAMILLHCSWLINHKDSVNHQLICNNICETEEGQSCG